jgi:hypothetical protein
MRFTMDYAQVIHTCLWRTQHHAGALGPAACRRRRPGIRGLEDGAQGDGNFDVPTAIENVLTLMRERAARGQVLERAIDPRLGTIRGDERKVKQVR